MDQHALLLVKTGNFPLLPSSDDMMVGSGSNLEVTPPAADQPGRTSHVAILI